MILIIILYAVLSLFVGPLLAIGYTLALLFAYFLFLTVYFAFTDHG